MLPIEGETMGDFKGRVRRQAYMDVQAGEVQPQTHLHRAPHSTLSATERPRDVRLADSLFRQMETETVDSGLLP